MKSEIRSIRAREIIDSRGNPTVEVEIRTASGLTARAASPSGASTGIHEAIEIRDTEDNRYGGKGVTKAVKRILEELTPILIGCDVSDQTKLDRLMISADGTNNKGRIGANSTIAVSMAISRFGAMVAGVPLWEYLGGPKARLLPVPMMNVLNGGVHVNWEGPDFQEYMIAPYGAFTYREALRWGSETYHALKVILKELEFATCVGDEGGFAPRIADNEKPLELITEAIQRAGYVPGKEIGIAIDPASSAFFRGGKYVLATEKKELGAEEMVDLYESLTESYPIILIEDGLSEDDWIGWESLTNRLGDRVELVGDDLFVTNVGRIQEGVNRRIANSVLIKPNQIGTVTETLEAVSLAHSNGYGSMISHRSGETVDSFIADLAVATSSGHLKTGAPCRGERVEKYNQLLRIEEALGDDAEYAGRSGFVR